MTIAFAGIGWTGASAPAALSGAAVEGAEPSRSLVVLGGAALGLVMGCLLGAAQAWTLRGSVEHAGRWILAILANAIGWVPAMAVIFLGATTPEAEWAWWQVAILGALTGCLAGLVLGSVLGNAVPRLGVGPLGDRREIEERTFGPRADDIGPLHSGPAPGDDMRHAAIQPAPRTPMTSTSTRQVAREQRPPSGPRRPGGHRLAHRATGLLLLLLVAAITVTLVRSATEDRRPEVPSGAVKAPAGLAVSEHIRVGRGDAPVVVSMYFDYLCPACGAFEAANGGELDRLLDAGTVQVELRPMAFLDDLSEGTEYSTRAANALATVADAAPDRVWAFHTALYDAQPEEGGPGLSDEAIAQLATDAGVPEAVAAHFPDGGFESWVAASTARAFDAGVEGTPTILIDGQTFGGDPYTTGPLTEAIEEATGDH